MNEIMDNRIKTLQQNKEKSMPKLKQAIEKNSGLLLKDGSVRLNED